MKKLYKIMLAALFIFSCFVPLSVSAYTSYNSLVFYKDINCGSFDYLYHSFTFSELSNSMVVWFDDYFYILKSDRIIENGTALDNPSFQGFHYLNGTFISGNWGAPFYFNDSSVRILYNDLGPILNSDIYSNWNSYTLSDFVSEFGKACSISSPSVGCSASSLYVLSNASVIGLLNSYAFNSKNVSSWELFKVTQTSGQATADICQQDGFDFKGVRSGYSLTVSYTDGTSSTFYSWDYYKQGFNGNSSGSYDAPYCKWFPASSWDTQSSVSVLTKSCYDSLNLSDNDKIEVNDSLGNSLIESGNSSSQASTSSINSTTNSLNSSASQYEQFESQFNSSLTSSLDNIDLNSINLVNSNDFVKTASWVKVQFDDILDSSGIYKTAISFVLIIGLALLLLGRRL